LAGINQRLRDQIEQFAMPPVVECVESKEVAITKLLQTGEETNEPDPAQLKYKADIRQKELNETGELRKRVEKLQEQNKLLIEQLKTALLAKRTPSGDAALRSEITRLEEKVSQLLAGKQQAKQKS
jgi:hypothetical protein